MEVEEKETSEYVIELTRIVRNLMYFIVDEGKSCIGKNQMKLYVSTYLMLFAKEMNQSSDPLDQNKIQQEIITDIEWLDFKKNN